VRNSKTLSVPPARKIRRNFCFLVIEGAIKGDVRVPSFPKNAINWRAI